MVCAREDFTLKSMGILVGTTLGYFCGFGAAYSLGVFLVPISREFDIGRGDTSWCLALVFAFQALANGFTGPLADRVAPRILSVVGAVLLTGSLLASSYVTSIYLLYLTCSLMGISVSFCFMPGLASLGKWFTASIGVASAISSAGGGVGNLALPALLESFIETMGWRHSLRITSALGGLFLLSCALILDPPAADRPSHSPAPKSPAASARSLFADPCFRVLFVAQLLGFIGYQAPFAHVAAYCQDVGLSAEQGSVALAVMGAGSIVGRIVGGQLADMLKRPTLVHCLNLAFMGITQVFWVVSGYNNAGTGVFYWAFMYGLFSGPFVALPPAVAREYFPKHMVGSASGIIFMSGVPGYLIGAPVSGILYDATNGSYLGGSMLGAFAQVGGSIMVAILLYKDGKISWKRKLHAHHEQTPMIVTDSEVE